MSELKENGAAMNPFADICPIADADVHESLKFLVKEPGFKYIVKAVMPDFDYETLSQQLLMLTTKDQFQMAVMQPFLKMLELKTTSGISWSGQEHLDGGAVGHVYITNHRDIVLDASFLNVCLINNGCPTCEVAIGDNLLIFDWIKVLVRLNKSFIVKRNLPPRQVLLEAKHLSDYINHTITERNQSLWIAQRQGRTKDSNDFTQESLLKMLTIGGSKKTFIERLIDLNLAPVAISYEYDPNDYLKAQEHLNKLKNPDFKKSKHDDLVSMETGMSKFKGHVHYTFTPCINDQLAAIPVDSLDKQQVVAEACRIVDAAIHANYRFFAVNYIAYDRLNNTTSFADKYNAEEVAAFEKYLDGQLAKIECIETDDDRRIALEYILSTYCNPLVNHLRLKEGY